MLVSATAIYNRHSVAQYQNEDLRSLGAYLQQRSGEREPLFVVSNYMAPAVAHDLSQDWKVFELPPVEATEAMESSMELVPLARHTFADHLPKGGPFWLAYTRSFHGDPDGAILGHLNENATLKKVQEFPGIVLYRGKSEAER